MSCTQVLSKIPAKNGLPTLISIRASSSDQRPKSDSGRIPKLGLAADAVASGKTPNLVNMKRGTGFRSSFSGIVATIFGATGCVGKGVVNRLGQTGAQMIVPYRGDHYDCMKLKVSGDLGQLLFTPYDLRDEDSIRKSVTHSNLVVNTVGREYATRNFTLHDVHVDGARRLARIAREAGVKRFIYVSHVNAREKPERVFLPKGSEWLRTKWLGEQATLEEFPDATIIRSVDVYGTNDWNITYINSPFRADDQSTIPVWKYGNLTVKQPLHVSDLVSGIVAAINEPDAAGKIFEAYGPDRILYADLLDWMFDVMDKYNEDWEYKRTDLRFNAKIFIKALWVQSLPSGQRYYRGCTIDKLERTHVSDTPLGYPNLEDLGVKAARVKDIMPSELEFYRAFGAHFYLPEAPRPPIMPLVHLSRIDEKQLELEKSQSFLRYLGIKSG